MKHLIVPFLLTVLFGTSLFGYFSSNKLPLTHDSQNHIARFANFYLAVKQGQFPPRWAPNLANGFGYPVFNFNYPLANLLALPFIAFDISIQSVFMFLSLMASMLGGLGMFYLSTQFSNRTGSLLSSISYFFSPYLANLLFVRGVIGELFVFGLLPWLLLSLYRLAKTPTRFYWTTTTLLLSGYLLSHNVLAYFGVPLLVAFLWWIRSNHLNDKAVRPLVVSGIISLLLVSFFWLPALLEKSLTILDDVSLSTDYLQHFVTIGQMVSDDHRSGFSYAGPVDGINYSIGFGQLLILICLIFMGRGFKKISWLAYLLVGYLLMQLSFSQPVWEVIPFGSMIQFPWRLGFFVSFLVALVIGKLWRDRPLTSLSIAIILVALGLARFTSAEWFYFPDEYWLTFSQTSSVLGENMPRTFDKFAAYRLKDKLFQDSPLRIQANGNPLPTIDKWNGSDHRYSLALRETATITEATAYFPGWRVTSNGEVLDSYPDEIGLVTYSLNPGTHEIRSYFSQRTPARIVGNVLTLLGIFSLLWYWHFLGKSYQ